MKDFSCILQAAVAERDHPWCLATLVKAEGSSYRQPGARLLVAPDGKRTIGYLSGGCLEEQIALRGLEVLADGVSREVTVDTRKLFGCDGRLLIYLERIPSAVGGTGNFLTHMAERLASRGLCRVVVPHARGGPSALLHENALVMERPGTFVQSVLPPPRLIVFGEGPEIAPMRLFATELGWVFESLVRPEELADDFVADVSTAAVIMTHKFGRDLIALDRFLPLNLPYIGLLGPKRRHLELVGRLVDMHRGEITAEALNVIHSPAGLDTGSESPEEIAFSIIGEVAAVMAGRKGGFLKDKPGTVHRMEAVA